MGVRIAWLRRGVGVEGEAPRRAAFRATVSLLEGLEGVGEEGSGDVGTDMVMVDDVFDNSGRGGKIVDQIDLEFKSISPPYI